MYNTPDDPNRVGSEDYIQSPLSSLDDPDAEYVHTEFKAPTTQDLLAEAILWLLESREGARDNAEFMLARHNKEKEAEAVEDAEREELARRIFGDPLKGLFNSFANKYGKQL